MPSSIAVRIMLLVLSLPQCVLCSDTYWFTSAVSQLNLGIGWLGSSVSSPPVLCGWGLTSFDPRHPHFKL